MEGYDKASACESRWMVRNPLCNLCSITRSNTAFLCVYQAEIPSTACVQADNFKLNGFQAARLDRVLCEKKGLNPRVRVPKMAIQFFRDAGL